MEQFDQHLSFDLPSAYQVKRETADDGSAVLQILYNITTDDNGEEKAELTINVKKSETSSISEAEKI